MTAGHPHTEPGTGGPAPATATTPLAPGEPHPGGRSSAWIAVAGAVFATALWTATGSAGLLYAVLYAVAVAPGAVLGRRLAGDRHPAGWIAGAVLGYGTTQIALWIPIFAGVPSPAGFIVVWMLQAAALLWIARRVSTPVITLPPAATGDVRAIAVTIVLVALLMGLPYRNLGAQDESGTRYYRAYFTADFVWHTALAAELGRYRTPPRNPYLASRPMNYYWTYFLLPAVVAHEAPGPLHDVQQVLKANAMLSALLVALMLLLVTRTGVPGPGIAAVAVGLGIVATSAEGTFVLQQLWRAGRPLAALEAMNIDAITAWQFKGLRIDGLARGFWYNPQHSFACALGLVSTLLAATAGARGGWGAIALAGITLGLATTFNPFVGGVFSLIYAVGITVDAARRHELAAALLRHAAAAVPVLLGLGWCVLNAVTGDAGDAVTVGLSGLTSRNAGSSLLLSTGPMLLPALVGLWPWRQLPVQPAVVAAGGAALALILMHTVTLSEASWVGFRTGQILQLMLPLLVARALWGLHRRGTLLLVGATILILVAGLPTTIIDTYNAQDITNREPGPGFRWTLPVTARQQEAFAWIQRSLPEDAIVQMEPMLRGREHWSLIPTFAQRRMSAGLPISLLPTPEYERGSQEVRQIFTTTDPRQAWQLARRRRIDYLYVDGDDRTAYPQGVAKFENQPAYFETVFDNGEVRLYRVR